MGDIFRKTSLEQAETPEKLDEYIKVTHPGIWSVLIACFAIIVAVAVWLAVGRIPTTMDMKGIIFPGSGVISITLDPKAEGQANSALWSNPAGNAVQLSNGMVCDILVVLDEQKPYELLMGI